jgi:hypothetical protein
MRYRPQTIGQQIPSGQYGNHAGAPVFDTGAVMDDEPTPKGMLPGRLGSQ